MKDMRTKVSGCAPNVSPEFWDWAYNILRVVWKSIACISQFPEVIISPFRQISDIIALACSETWAELLLFLTITNSSV